ncbi:MaoC/PaaZ C-terminal domain-containing protein [Variovorax sp. Sphag1AA]|uniref:MaoC/PaaZ C-terminal domain-containing protein n=1 Tax=Variovorax sp. Sphag1AA TaxID=2587027 RepID=UPI0016209711|nr:MaoC/PaaZ C-terminal domain-containing protein [Variovorax sp. Sphag1AA]MBB3181601.1 acyl dehydratase [Variovorax sp. Sphag1AA]
MTATGTDPPIHPALPKDASRCNAGLAKTASLGGTAFLCCASTAPLEFVVRSASGDHNPIHIDIDFARSAGLDDVFAHGMLSAAYLGRLVSDWAGQKRMRNLQVRFTGITHVHDAPLCTGKVVERFDEGGETRLRVDLQCANQKGEVKLTGQAVVAIH